MVYCELHYFPIPSLPFNLLQLLYYFLSSDFSAAPPVVSFQLVSDVLSVMAVDLHSCSSHDCTIPAV